MPLGPTKSRASSRAVAAAASRCVRMFRCLGSGASDFLLFVRVLFFCCSGPRGRLIEFPLRVLVFFVVTTSFIDEQFDVTLFEAETGEASCDQALVVLVDAEGRFSIGNDGATIERIQEFFQNDRIDDREVDVRADDATCHGHVVEILDSARQSGVRRPGIRVAERCRVRIGPESIIDQPNDGGGSILRLVLQRPLDSETG